MVVDDGVCREEVRLAQPTKALYVPPGVWCTQYNFDKSSVLAVVASDPYDPGDYIRSYREYLEFVQPKRDGN